TKGKIFRQSGIDGTDGNLIVLIDFSIAPIELKPIAIIGNMTAGDHDAWCLLRDRIIAQCRGRQYAAIYRLTSCILDRCHAECCNSRTGRTKVATDEYLVALLQFSGFRDHSNE